ncbi:preprotein translocase subunit SecE [Nocardioides sp. B-3]|uniref:preprotein translocase subunit SecE n=1 Tax=Nocardioides sp. B-3 TaxID=2895565 RepID=UPI0021530B54|nr:preprotein translocase subunit SecE [Nocardioides sp. B-3]UUZ60688.1 preprotein translocase subunit SecE [Nocardioides sp. B-3]
MSDSSAVHESREDSRHDDGRRTGPATFYRRVVAELRKVVWPTQEQLITYFPGRDGLRPRDDGVRLGPRPGIRQARVCRVRQRLWSVTARRFAGRASRP